MGAAVFGIGMGLQAINSIQQGEAAYDASRRNAALLSIQRGLVLQQGAKEAGKIQAQGRQVQATATAATVANSLDPTIGSAAGQIAQSGINAGSDAVRVRAQAALEAWGLAEKRKETLAQGKAARTAGYLGALGGGLQGAGYMIGNK